jgi:hypothetical protein
VLLVDAVVQDKIMIDELKRIAELLQDIRARLHDHNPGGDFLTEAERECEAARRETLGYDSER